MIKPRIKVFSDMGQEPSSLATHMTKCINEWLLENNIAYDDIDKFQANMTTGQDGPNGNELWFCYTATIVYTD